MTRPFMLKEHVAAKDMLSVVPYRAGGGDCGTTLRHGAEAALQDADAGKIPWSNAVRAATALAASVRSMGGTSGALYNIFFTAAAGAPAFCSGPVSISHRMCC